MTTDSRDASAGSPDRFGYEWDRFHKLTDYQEEQFRRWTCLLPAETAWRGRSFLDMGCGAGRNSFWCMKYGATGGHAIDIDDRSLAWARDNLKAHPTVEVRHQSAYDVDLNDAVDIAFSIGVIHHLKHPEIAVRNLAKAAKPGGTILIWVYGYENLEVFVNILDPLRKALFSRMPLPLLRWLTYVPTSVLWVLLRLGFGRIEYLK
ncbi:MAG: class I SAM-dependent methyltransferase [Alphaproteobacteria bacterium]|nr:class I SAM-dependent methyltransferase [Alphaproteobacteria bacterium]